MELALVVIQLEQTKVLPCAVRYERWIQVPTHKELWICSCKNLGINQQMGIGNPVMKASKLILRKCGEAEMWEVDTLLCTNHASFVLGMNPLHNITSEWAGIMLWLEPHQRPSVPGGCGCKALRFGNWFLLTLVEEEEKWCKCWSSTL